MLNKILSKKLPDHKLNFYAIFICLLGTIFYYYEYYLRVAPGVIRAELKLAYNISEAGFGSLVAWYYWAYVPLQLVVGIFMDLLGPRKSLTLACLISAVGTYLFVGTDWLTVAQLGRFLVGFGAAFAYVGVLNLTNIWLPRTWFAFMAGLCSTLGMLGAISGQVVISKCVDLFGWQVTLYGSAIIGIILSGILWLCIRDQQSQLTASIAVNKVNITNNNLNITSKLKILWSELKQVIKLPDLWLNGIIGCLAFAGLSVFADVWGGSFLAVLGMPKELIATSSALIYLGFGIGAPLWGILSDLINSRKLLLFLGTLVAAILLIIIIYVPISFGLLKVCLLLFGFFIGVEILVFAAINDLCEQEISATAVGFVNMLIMLGGFYLPPKIGWILDSLNNMDELWSFKLALSVLPLGLLLAAILSTRLCRSREPSLCSE